jgi:hypothetical protein
MLFTYDNINLVTTLYSLLYGEENKTIIITCTIHRCKNRDLSFDVYYSTNVTRFSSNIKISKANTLISYNIKLIMKQK